MKKLNYYLFTLFIISPLISGAQDIIFTISNEDIKAKVIEINQSEVKYKKFDNLGGPTFTINKSEVIFIRYENGTKDVFNENKATVTQPAVAPISKVVNYTEAGINDSKENYIGQNSGAGWTAAVTVLTSPLIGIIPAAICSSVEPSAINLNANSELMKNATYSKAYKEEAHKTKKRKVWTGYGIGSLTWLAVFLLLY